MFFLRVLSFFAGSFVAFAAPFYLLTERQGSAPGGVAMIALALLAVLVFGLSYFYFALLGHQLARNPAMRRWGACLIVLQMGAGAWLLHASTEPHTLIAVAPLLCFSVLLFFTFVWPGNSGSSHRPMRRREG